MEYHYIQTIEDFTSLQSYILNNTFHKPTVVNTLHQYKIQFDQSEQFIIPINKFSKDQQANIHSWVSKFKQDHLIFGKNEKQNIVSCEVNNDSIELFIEKGGVVTTETIPNKYWIVSSRQFTNEWQRLNGSLHYKYIKYYNTKESYYLDKNKYRQADIFSVGDPKEAAMILNGFTYFKGTKANDVSRLSFDIESTTLEHNSKSKVLLISNTFVSQGNTIKKLFAYDEYENDAMFLNAWCNWVRDINPSIILGHNIFGYDLPYLNFVAKKNSTSLSLGRNGSDIVFSKKPSKFRKDGSQDYDYYRAYIHGREIVDTMFLAYHFDVSRKYESYGLKQIIKQENLEIENRQFYDASKIAENYTNPEEWAKIKNYARDDADDAMALYNLMIPAYFYLTQSVPKSFQAINYTASGSQINAFLIRSYLQDGHSLPLASPPKSYPGAISEGYAGIYDNVFKVDVASLYPSIMLEYQVYDANKDPNRHFLQMVEYFTEKRLEHKKIAKETNDRYYQDLEQSEKIIINSAYGMLGAVGLLFNSPKLAAFVTEKGREILKTAILWATGKPYVEKQPEPEASNEE